LKEFILRDYREAIGREDMKVTLAYIHMQWKR